MSGDKPDALAAIWPSEVDGWRVDIEYKDRRGRWMPFTVAHAVTLRGAKRVARRELRKRLRIIEHERQHPVIITPEDLKEPTK